MKIKSNKILQKEIFEDKVKGNINKETIRNSFYEKEVSDREREDGSIRERREGGGSNKDKETNTSHVYHTMVYSMMGGRVKNVFQWSKMAYNLCRVRFCES